ncbi:MAG: T9SS type A sorting domain-containing protein, partial [Saprospiraceae bacterium]|nr:T9SS type A sorting domain-containing protein [Saprospiraceae bacterium]
GLGHTLDSLAVMYPALTPGASRRTFDAGTREGADEIIAESAGAGACGNLQNFVPAPDCEVSATNALPGQSFGIYPNPATDKLWISLPEHVAGSISVSLRSMTGEIVSDQNVESGKISRSFSVDLSGLAPGIYFLTIYSGGERFSSKLIKM